MSNPTIYAFVNGTALGCLRAVAIAEDGEVLAMHASSNEAFAKHDIGLTSDWKHANYRQKYPDGYQLVWLESGNADDQAIVERLFEKNQAREPAAAAEVSS